MDEKVINGKVKLYVCSNCNTIELPQDNDGECPNCGYMDVMTETEFNKVSTLIDLLNDWESNPNTLPSSWLVRRIRGELGYKK